uniref:helix-turn-helix transcriptional regulator n=1 Tax=Hylemonella sp. TaxID=2066020 RepID=UPI0035B31019
MQVQTDSPPKAPTAQPEKLLRLPAVCELTGLGKSSVYSIEGFPKPVVLSRRAVAWKLSELQAWIDSRVKAGGR